MEWLITGAGGMLAQDVATQAERHGIQVRRATRDELDITDPAAVRRMLAGADAVINCAAYTAVDAAEDHGAQAFAVNAVGPAVLAEAAAESGALVVHYSTDYVFDGGATRPYAETALPNPRTAYGRSKVAGEWAVRAACTRHLILRTAWLYGAGGRCFPRTIARLAADRDQVAVVADQVGSPTWTRDVADLTVRLVTAEVPSGIYHATAAGQCSWFEFAQAVVAASGAGTVTRTTSAHFPTPAERPAYSVLGHEALTRVGVAPIGDWRERWEEAAESVLSGANPTL